MSTVPLAPLITVPAPRPSRVRQAPARSGLPPKGAPAVPVTADTADARAQVAIRFAMTQLGPPYVWGGDGPQEGTAASTALG